MANIRRGMRGIKTIGSLVDARRTRTAAGALMELSVLASERSRLDQELERWRRRHVEINLRLAEIANKERRLREFVKKPKRAPRVESTLSHANDGQRIRTTELSY